MEKEITWLDKESKNMNEVDLFDWITKICNPEQTGIIMDHIKLLENNMLIGFDETDVYVMFIGDNEDEEIEILKIKKN